MFRTHFRLALVLGLITAVGPFAIDMYLPALPGIGGALHAPAGLVQMTLGVFFVVSGLFQPLFGPLSDMFGRKRPIYVGMLIFIAGSIGCALARNIETLIFFRGVQALGSCAGSVAPRAVVRDMMTGPDAARMMALLMLVFSVSPILAPVTGSAVIAVFGWRGVFWAIAVAAVVGLTLAVTQLKETRPAKLRQDSSLRTALSSYGVLLRDPHYLGMVLVGSFAFSAFLVYLANASFVIIGHFGLTPTQFSLCFSMNAAAFIGASQFAGRLGHRLGMTRLLRAAGFGFAGVMVLLAALTALGMDNLFAMLALLFVGFGFVGLIMPTSGVLAMEHHASRAGAASAALGSFNTLIGSLCMGLSALFSHDKPLPMVVGVAACAVVSCLVAQWAVKKEPPRAPAPARPSQVATGT